MPSAITSSTSSAGASYGAGASSTASLQAQLQRYQKQLSDCVNCASAKTPQGKADIQAISARISQVKHSIEQADKTQGNSGSANQTNDRPNAASPAGFGGLIDVFA